jgi:DNA-binding protein HU-beta
LTPSFETPPVKRSFEQQKTTDEKSCCSIAGSRGSLALIFEHTVGTTAQEPSFAIFDGERTARKPPKGFAPSTTTRSHSEELDMNKKELAAKLAKQTGITQAKAIEVINSLFDTRSGKGIIASELDGGKKVTIPGFGTFGTRTRAARTGTNPSTKQKIKIAAKTYPYFRPGKTLKERVAK